VFTAISGYLCAIYLCVDIIIIQISNNKSNETHQNYEKSLQERYFRLLEEKIKLQNELCEKEDEINKLKK
jgi:hypothetical protein